MAEYDTSFVAEGIPKEGEVTGVYCDGSDKYEIIANGAGGHIPRLVMVNCRECGYVTPEEAEAFHALGGVKHILDTNP